MIFILKSWLKLLVLCDGTPDGRYASRIVSYEPADGASLQKDFA